jgi:hypothetical protein
MNQEIINGKLAEGNNVEIISQVQHPVRWVDFTPETNHDLDQYEKAYVGNGEHYILRSKMASDVYMKVSRDAFFRSLLQRNSNELLSKPRGLLSRMEAERMNTPIGVPSRVKGMPDYIDPNKPPRNYRNAVQREVQQEGAEAYAKEYQGFIEQGTLKFSRPEKVA